MRMDVFPSPHCVNAGDLVFDVFPVINGLRKCPSISGFGGIPKRSSSVGNRSIKFTGVFTRDLNLLLEG